MKFEIYRTSACWRPEKAPCAGAFKEGHEWFIEVADLSALVALGGKTGCELIIGDKRIEIYDDYRE